MRLCKTVYCESTDRAREKVQILHGELTESGGIGIHGRLKICCLRACGFKSRLSDDGLIVQLGERCLCKAEVGGSSPPQSTKGRMAEWFKALVLKTGVGTRCLPWVRIPLLPFLCGETVSQETLDLPFLVRIQAEEFSVLVSTTI